jgi:hypothetical protein
VRAADERIDERIQAMLQGQRASPCGKPQLQKITPRDQAV